MSRPPYSAEVGGQSTDLIDKYLEYVGKKLEPVTVADGIYASVINNISLRDYIHIHIARTMLKIALNV